MRSIVVIGGGFAGVAAATALAEEGVGVTLLESRGHLGGRASSSPPSGSFPAPADNGPHLFMGCYGETRRLLERIGASDDITWTPPLRLTFLLPGGRRVPLKAAPLPAPFHAIASLLTTPLFPWKEKPAVLRAFLPFSKRPFPDWTREGPVTGLLERTRQGPVSRERFWDPFCLSVMNAPPSSAPLRGFGEVLHRVFFGARANSILGIAKKPLSDVLFPLVPGWLGQRGGRVLLNAGVQGLEPGDKDRRPPLRVATGGGKIHDGDAVVWAVPPHHLPDLWKPGAGPETPDHHRLGKSPILSANLIWDRVLLKDPMAGLPGSRFEWVFNRNSNWGWKAPDGKGQYLSFVASACSDLQGLSDEQLVEKAAGDLRGRLGAAAPARVLHSRVIRELAATIDWNPGNDRLRPPMATSDPRVFLAGDWTDTGLPATVEGAVFSGHRAARAVLDLLGPSGS